MSREYQAEQYVNEIEEREFQIDGVYLNETQASAPVYTPLTEFTMQSQPRFEKYVPVPY